MAAKSTVIKAELQVSDMDRHYYASHPLTLAQHPSETELRLMVRLLTFALFAEERLAFGRGLSSDEEPDLWRIDYSGLVEQWIELGQPDESRLRKAAGRAAEVIVVGYGGRAFGIWMQRNAAVLARLGSRLRVVEIPADAAEALLGLFQRSMRLQCLVQDGEVQLMDDAGGLVTLRPVLHGTAAG